MIGFDEIRKLARVTQSKIVLLVMDGIGGLPHPETGSTELETAHIPNLDRVALEGICGMLHPVSPGITPGSAPGHMSLFGYDPMQYQFGRGIVEALGLDVEVLPGDVVARGNFCTVDDSGLVSDRRAGRPATELNHELCNLLNEGAKVKDTEIALFPGKEHRFVIRLRGEGLSPEVTDTDPQYEGMAPLPAQALDSTGRRTALVANSVIEQARELLKDRHPANMLLLRGFSQRPDLPLAPRHLPPHAGLYRHLSHVPRRLSRRGHGHTAGWRDATGPGRSAAPEL